MPSNCSQDQIEEMLEHALVLSLYQSASDYEEDEQMADIEWPEMVDSNYEKLAFDALLALSFHVNQDASADDVSSQHPLDSIAFHGLSVRCVHNVDNYEELLLSASLLDRVMYHFKTGFAN